MLYEDGIEMPETMMKYLGVRRFLRYTKSITKKESEQ